MLASLWGLSFDDRRGNVVMMKWREDGMKLAISQWSTFCHHLFHFQGFPQQSTKHQSPIRFPLSMSPSQAHRTSIRLCTVLRNIISSTKYSTSCKGTPRIPQRQRYYPVPGRFTQQSRTLRSMAAETDSQAAVVANTSGVTPDSLEATLKSKLEAEKAEVIDISGLWYTNQGKGCH